MKKIKIYMQCLAMGLVFLSSLTGCDKTQVVNSPERTNLIAKEFANEARALNHELDTYDEIMTYYPDDTENEVLNHTVLGFLKQSEVVTKEAIKLDAVDIQYYEGEADNLFFLASLENDKKLPFTALGEMKKNDSGAYAVDQMSLSPYYANLPKTSLMQEADTIAVVSQQPFSTFEEVYFYKYSKSLKLFDRGWEDDSLTYYAELNKYLDANQLDEAMALPDTSMYPMAYEKVLFPTTNKWIEKSVAAANDEKYPLKKRMEWLEWSLNYYVQNHYGQDLSELVTTKFEGLSGGKDEVFGSDYLLPKETLIKALKTYGDLKARLGEETYAQTLNKAIMHIK